MRVLCSKCQFENQADPNASRVVCARCATIIDVALGDNFGGGYGGGNLGASGNFGSPSSGNFGANYSSGYEQTIRPGAYPPAPTNRPQLPEGDVYATRIDDDFDDVLDIPRPNNQLQSYSYNDSAPAFDDVFSSPGGGYGNTGGSYETMIDSRPSDPYQQSNPFQQPSTYQQPNNYQQPNAYQANAYQQGNAYDATSNFEQPNYGGQQADAEFMGWPVLPEDTTDPGIPPSSAFSKKGGLLKGALMLGALAVLLFIGYSWLTGGKKNTNKPSTAVTPEEPGGSGEVTGTTGGTTTPPNVATTANPAPVGPTGQAGPAAGQPSTKGGVVVIPPSTVTDPKTGKATATVLPPKTTSTVAPPAPAPVTAAATTPNKGNITIQAGSYSDQGQASARVAALKNAGVDARVVSAQIAGKGTWYRVQIGRFPSREAASSYANGLRGKGALTEFLVTPVN